MPQPPAKSNQPLVTEVSIASPDIDAIEQVLRAERSTGNTVALVAYSSPQRLPGKDLDLAHVFSGYFYVHLGGPLAAKLLESGASNRPHDVPTFAAEVLRESGKRDILIRRSHILFEPSLLINPLAMARDLGRKYNLLFEWPGKLTTEGLVFADPGHPAYRLLPFAKIGFPIFHLN